MARNFTATIKEVPGDAPFEVHFEAHDDIGTGMRTVVLRLQPGATLQDARALATMLNAKVQAIGLQDLYWPNDPVMQ